MANAIEWHPAESITQGAWICDCPEVFSANGVAQQSTGSRSAPCVTIGRQIHSTSKRLPS